jgi:glycosyltransferase involved in cell wall biosynthesis
MIRSVVHLTTYLQGGAGRAVVDLACAQHVAGWRVLVVTSKTARGGFGNYPQYLTQLEAAGVPCWIEDSLFQRDPTANQRVLTRLARAWSPGPATVVHAHAGTPARIGLAYARTLAPRPIVVQTQHGWGLNKTSEQAAEDIATLRAVDRVVVTSPATGDLLARFGVAAGSITVVPCGLASEPPRPNLEALGIVRRFHEQGRLVLGCVGSVTPNKNQTVVVRAVGRAAGRLAAVIVGEGRERLARAIRDARATGDVHLAGFQPDGDAWVASVDVLVAPSLTEGQGLVVLEAFRAGVPVVASDIAPLRALVEDGRTGWIFDPYDPGSLVEALSRHTQAAQAQRDEIRAASRRVFEQDYTMVEMVRRHEQVYRTVRSSIAVAS